MKKLKTLNSEKFPVIIPNCEIFVYFDRNSKEFDQIIKTVNLVTFINIFILKIKGGKIL